MPVLFSVSFESDIPLAPYLLSLSDNCNDDSDGDIHHNQAPWSSHSVHVLHSRATGKYLLSTNDLSDCVVSYLRAFAISFAACQLCDLSAVRHVTLCLHLYNGDYESKKCSNTFKCTGSA